MKFEKKIMRWVKNFFLISIFFFLIPSFAVTSNGFKFSSKQLLLHTHNNDQIELYFFQNKSSHNLLLTHPHDKQGASAGWDSILRPQHWSVFAVNRPNFSMSCSLLKKNYKTVETSCQEVLKVSHCMRLKIIKKNLTSTFWVAEDGSLKQIQRILKSRGFFCQ